MASVWGGAWGSAWASSWDEAEAAGAVLAEVVRLTSAVVTARRVESPLATQRDLASAIVTARGFDSLIDLEA